MVYMSDIIFSLLRLVARAGLLFATLAAGEQVPHSPGLQRWADINRECPTFFVPVVLPIQI